MRIHFGTNPIVIVHVINNKKNNPGLVLLRQLSSGMTYVFNSGRHFFR